MVIVVSAMELMMPFKEHLNLSVILLNTSVCVDQVLIKIAEDGAGWLEVKIHRSSAQEGLYVTIEAVSEEVRVQLHEPPLSARPFEEGTQFSTIPSVDFEAVSVIRRAL